MTGAGRAPWVVYILECAGRALYVGITTDAARRLAEHRAGQASAYTAAHRPVRLVYQEPHDDRSSALRREAHVKRWTHAQKRALIQGRAARAGGEPAA